MRVLGSAIGWLLFGAGATLLTASITTSSGAAAFCATGPIDAVSTTCASAAGWALPIGVITVLLALAIAIVVGRGFGTPLPGWAAPVLLIVVGGAIGSATTIPAYGVAVGLFLVAVILLGLELRAGPARLVGGSRDAAGRPFRTVEPARRTPTHRPAAGALAEDAVRRSASDVLLAVGITIATAGIGVAVALLLFRATTVTPTTPGTPGVGITISAPS